MPDATTHHQEEQQFASHLASGAAMTILVLMSFGTLVALCRWAVDYGMWVVRLSF